MNNKNRLFRGRADFSWPEVFLPASADLTDFKLALQDLFQQLQESVTQPAAKDTLERFKQICQQQAEVIRVSPDFDIDQLSEHLQQYWSNLVIFVRWMVTVPGQFEKITEELFNNYAEGFRQAGTKAIQAVSPKLPRSDPRTDQSRQPPL